MAPTTAPRLRDLQITACSMLRNCGLSTHADGLHEASTADEIDPAVSTALDVLHYAAAVLRAEGHEPSEYMRECKAALCELATELRCEPRDEDRRIA